MDFLFAPFAFAIRFPGIILLPAAVFAAAWWFFGGSRLVLVTALAWLAYFGWELLIRYRSPEANIRVDLLLIAPLLLVLSAVSIFLLVKGAMNR